MYTRSQLTTVLALFLTAMMSCQLFANDPGAPDTVYVTGGPLALSHSRPITISVTNDEPVAGWSLGFLLESLDGGFARFDSSRWVGRTSDPNIFGDRLNRYCACEPTPATSPDIVISGASKGSLSSLPPGRGELVELFFTGLAVGSFSVDSVYFPPAGMFMLINEPSPHTAIRPKFVGGTFEVLDASLPPSIYLPQTEYTIVTSSGVSFEVNGVSNIGGAIELSLKSFNLFDDFEHAPDNSPVVTGSDPLTFQWSPAITDVGIWEATFESCDTSGNCVSKSLIVQVVSSASYSIAFDQSVQDGAPFSTGIAIGDADGDGIPEIVVSGDASEGSPAEVLYEVSTGPALTQVYVNQGENLSFGAVSGMINGDNFADFATMYLDIIPAPHYQVRSLLSNGDNTFEEVLDTNGGYVTRSCVLAELTGDAHLDIASTWYDGLRIFTGNSQGEFFFSKFISIPTDSTLSVNAGDFNSDGHQDLAIGTKLGLRVYLADGSGEFQFSQLYSQTNGSLEIEVTNAASDLNGDGQVDLCISTPSIGGARSQMITYFGNSNGLFDQVIVRDVRGQIFGNSFGDVNNDGELDIIYVNGAEHYLAIAFGDPAQTFANEIRISTGDYSPRHVASFDADSDGDLDIVVTAVRGSAPLISRVVMLFENLTDPDGFQRTLLSIDARNGYGIALSTPSDRVVSSVRNTVASAMFNERNADSDAVLDAYIRLSAVEQGTYIVSVPPQADKSNGELITIEYSVGISSFRLIKDAPASALGFNFGVCASSESAVSPRPGSFSSANPPLLSWTGQGSHELQVASEPTFESILVDTTVDGNSCQLLDSIAVSDTTALFWRVRASGNSEFGCIYALNLIATPWECGDADASGMSNVSDIVFLINFIFGGGTAPSPIEHGDIDCGGTVNISDVVYLISYIFLGGAAPCSACL